MPTVATLPGGIRVVQHQVDHNPPHFHVMQAADEVEILIAELTDYRGSINRSALHDVLIWARDHQAELALNWVLALAGIRVRSIPVP
jgi:Domain of unknown function (DUF4160)